MAVLFVGMLRTQEYGVPFISSFSPQKPIPRKTLTSLIMLKENSYHMDWMWIGYQWISITKPIQVGQEKIEVPKKAFLFPISHHIPGKQELRNNHNFRGTKKDELLEHGASIKTLI